MVVDSLVRRFIDARLLDTEYGDFVILLYSVFGAPPKVNIYGLRELLDEYGIVLSGHKYEDGILRLALDDDVESECYIRHGVKVEFYKLVKAIYDIQEFVNDVVLVSSENSIENVVVDGYIDVIVVAIFYNDFSVFTAGMTDLGYVVKKHLVVSSDRVEVYFDSDELPDRLRTVYG